MATTSHLNEDDGEHDKGNVDGLDGWSVSVLLALAWLGLEWARDLLDMPLREWPNHHPTRPS